VANPKAETYRHALAVTTTRPGLDGKPYLYTLNMSCPQVSSVECWDVLCVECAVELLSRKDVMVRVQLVL
jgi:hypothetical protein